MMRDYPPEFSERSEKIRVATLECSSARKITFIQPIEAARPTEPDKTYLNSNHPQKPAYPTTATTPHCTLRHGS